MNILEVILKINPNAEAVVIDNDINTIEWHNGTTPISKADIEAKMVEVQADIMANTYKFKGVALASASETSLLTASSNETLIVKSIRVTNNTSNTPTFSLDVLDSSASNAEFTILKTQSLAANSSVEILTVPLILESSDQLKATVSSSDSVHIGISYLNIT
jgi:translation initiation factor 2 alpha subunit (eIF-2alpha)